MTQNTRKPALSPWPVRLIAFAAMVGLALLAIRIIDSHVMARADAMMQVKPDTPMTNSTPDTMTNDPQP